MQGPRSWPTWYKAFTVTTVSLDATVVSLFSTLYTSGIPGLQAEFHVSKLVALLGLTTYLLGMAAGSLVVAPMSESLGRRPLYIASMAAFQALVLPSALAESIATIIATRFFGGFFDSTMMSNSPATVNDIVSDKHRALASGFWSIGPANGPVYGPLIGGFVYQHKEPLLRRIVNLHPKNPATGNVKPEARVSIVCISAVLLAVGQLWFAWTCRPGTHWIVPILAGVSYGAGNACTFIYADNYMAQSYGIYGASALAGNMVLRSIMGACLPLAGPSMYGTLGLSWAGTLLGLVEMVCVSVPAAFYFDGYKIRQGSSMMQEITKL
ncbi:major facilitator superfamily transporter [Colletotrichum tamarilloi]|uniref:Major facilitator superfamily transporter n=1 Tax=Colletotrichum tamarilloi TaxID=1209934 RepID=A0ABQ9RME7_9PEZI|nr:major facilitator superfamily transporter [Colletotrichum tamarilloi]KAK1507681.1 major facilitator superfamily transporter [Colletotrichum tamarilloi]